MTYTRIIFVFFLCTFFFSCENFLDLDVNPFGSSYGSGDIYVTVIDLLDRPVANVAVELSMDTWVERTDTADVFGNVAFTGLSVWHDELTNIFYPQKKPAGYYNYGVTAIYYTTGPTSQKIVAGKSSIQLKTSPVNVTLKLPVDTQPKPFNRNTYTSHPPQLQN